MVIRIMSPMLFCMISGEIFMIEIWDNFFFVSQGNVCRVNVMPCKVVEPVQPNCIIAAKVTNKSSMCVDFTSLYPHVNRSKTVPTGHPKIITDNFDEDVSNYFGLIQCTVLPPRALFHPVLPYRTQNKLMFALCKTCTDTGNQTLCTHVPMPKEPSKQRGAASS